VVLAPPDRRHRGNVAEVHDLAEIRRGEPGSGRVSVDGDDP
jgi:hypothetical protein